MKNSNDTIGNRTRDLQACSTVPQQIAPPRAPVILLYLELLSKCTEYEGQSVISTSYLTSR
jgi:hypothetical protein